QTANAVFSVFAWVKGGMPSQVIFSQAGLSDWLGADTTNGSLMTELNFLFKPSLPLQSQTVITDGNWHRIGLVWDGSNRILYVDDVEVASDTYDKGYLFGDLQIGAGKNLEPGSFFSGLIDDVRIYDRAITP
ncbi:MAG: LamG-like jellyroll fold domain-containing protein, partial [Planctomycetota bacterium]